METKVVLLLVLISISGLEASDAMKFLAKGFLKVMDECKEELNLQDKLTTDLYHYWKLDYSLLSRDTGCAIVCMSRRLQLMGEDGNMHHGNAKEFAVTHGADEDLAGRLVTVIHECEKQHAGVEDLCLRVLEVAKCFRSGIYDLNWSPKVDVIITEVMADVQR